MPERTRNPMPEFKAYIEKLCEEGGRGACSAEEARAAGFMREKLEALGLDVTVQRFRTCSSFALPVLFHILVAFLGAILIGCCPVTAMLLIGLAAVSFTGEYTCRWRILSRILPTRVSQNVIGRHRPEDPQRTIILSGHLDSAQAGLIFQPRLVQLFSKKRTSTGPLFPLATAMVLLFLVALISAFGGEGALLTLIDWLAAVVLVVSGVLMVQWMRAENVPGANDNASGIAGVLTLAESIMKKIPKKTEFYFIGFGAEEPHLTGSIEFVRAYSHRFDPENTYIINMDGIASGKLHYTTGEGIIWPQSYPDQELSILARTLTRAGKRFADIQPVIPKGHTDALPFAMAGFKVISLVCLEENGAPTNYHQPGDSSENMHWEHTELALEFIEAIVAAVRV